MWNSEHKSLLMAVENFAVSIHPCSRLSQTILCKMSFTWCSEWLTHFIERLITTATAYDKQKHQKSTNAHRKAYKVLEGSMIQKLLKSINECGVAFKMWYDKNDSEKDKNLNWASLMGPEKLKLLKFSPGKLWTDDCQPHDMALEVAELWEVNNYNRTHSKVIQT